ncbi:hypothetical protein P170DRAFT_505441 [Aspergillus steynii IBT 23096]|uniref:GPI ethanolamine phosphate transferase 2 C-terminal domain-containing protein n=1 Tax=Aspergillus steynii IBT 23096 TaxID=1392250 RepID=A0A2I2GPE1_9EURO|nr:uncharacterized protein P170DRAFT_505441 [Aspergillus steynii IBT 23096]PLB54742.1 hypothetical protein P170DRAFT_505441 [Aspergillus steynii IBT 23096]
MSEQPPPNSLPKPRRVVTGHNKNGHATVQHDSYLDVQPYGDGTCLTPFWYTGEQPADVSSPEDKARLKPSMPPTGSGFTAYDLPPQSQGLFHRSITLDYVIVAKGSLVLGLDDGSRVHLTEGDVVVQQATMHSWNNESTEWARVYGIMFPAQAPVVDGKVLENIWPLLVHTVGLYFFAKGFLLSRRALESTSTCTRPLLPHFQLNESSHLESAQNGCWMPRSFDKAVILVIDALRYDFTVPYSPKTSKQDAPQPFHNALTILHEKATQEPHNAVLFPFIADPPTTTLQRLKGLTTGTLPTFIEAGANFAGSALAEDNIVTQLHKAGKGLVHLGDDTWIKLFPNHFLPNLSHAYDSFLVSDLHTVDNGVEKHLLPLISSRQDEWNVIFGHFLGVDHVGHRFGPVHGEMTSKLKQMDRLIRQVIDLVDENTLLVVLGDHGMDEHGNHGGETDNEVQAALWMYTRRKHFGHLQPYPQNQASYINKRPIAQIDIVPTLSLLLGIPIPFNSLGSPIEEAFIGATGDNWRQLMHAQMLSLAQVERFHQQYTRTGNPPHVTEHDHTDFSRCTSWQGIDFQDSSSLETIYRQLRDYQKTILQYYKHIWAQFSIPHMLEGLLILSFGAIALLLCICGSDEDNITPGASSGTIAIGVATGVVSFFFHTALTWSAGTSVTEGLMLSTTMSSLTLLNCHFPLVGLIRTLKHGYKLTFLDLLTIAFTLLLSIGFASNSYTVWEDRIVLTFLTTFGVCAFSALFQRSLERPSVQIRRTKPRSSGYGVTLRAQIFLSRVTLVIALAGIGMTLAPKWNMTMTSVQSNMVTTTSILVICSLLSGPMGGGSLSTLYLQILSLRKLLDRSPNYTIGPTIAALLGTLHFFGTGHNATFSSIQWGAAYIPFEGLHYPWSPMLVLLNTFSGPIVAAFSTALIAARDEHEHSPESHLVTKSLAIHILVYTVWTLSTAVWAGVLRRHLMVFAIFCPRFLMAGASLLIVDIVAIIVSFIMR